MFCKYCGRKMEKEDAVCSYCGREREAMQYSTGLEELLGEQSEREHPMWREDSRREPEEAPPKIQDEPEQPQTERRRRHQEQEQSARRDRMIRNIFILVFVLLVGIAAIIRFAMPSRKQTQGGAGLTTETAETAETYEAMETSAEEGKSEETETPVTTETESPAAAEQKTANTLVGISGSGSTQMMMDTIKKQSETISQLQEEVQSLQEELSQFQEYLFAYFADGTIGREDFENWCLTNE